MTNPTGNFPSDSLVTLLKSCRTAAQAGPLELEGAVRQILDRCSLDVDSPQSALSAVLSAAVTAKVEELASQIDRPLAVVLVLYAELSRFFDESLPGAAGRNAVPLRQSAAFKLVGAMGEYQAAAALTRELITQYSSAQYSTAHDGTAHDGAAKYSEERGRAPYSARISAALYVWERLLSQLIGLVTSLTIKGGEGVEDGISERLSGLARGLATALSGDAAKSLTPDKVSEFLGLSS